MKRNALHKLLAVLCMLLCIVLLACACSSEEPAPEGDEPSNDPPSGDPTVTYTITVTDKDTSAPIEGATVELFSGNTSKGTCTTNASGVATFEVPEGVYTTVKVSKDGYADNSSMIPTDSMSVAIQLTADTTASYKVTVLDWKDSPIVGVPVQLCVGDICRMPVVTDANGVAEFQLERADYTVKVITSEYAVAEHYNFAEGETELTVSLNPLFFDEPENNSLTVGAGKTVYFAFRADGATMNLQGDDVTVVHNEQTYRSEGGMVTITECVSDGYSPALFAVTNNGSAEATYIISFLYPVGYMQNPAELVIGSNSIATKNDYYYAYTATVAGTLTVTMDAACTDWSYTIHNQTAEIYGSNHSSNDDPQTASQTITLSAGDTVQIIISSASGLEVSTIIFTAAFEAAA